MLVLSSLALNIASQNDTYAVRAAATSNNIAQKLFLLMEEKQTNLAVAADVTSKAALLVLADAVGPEICLLKTHIDIIQDFDEDLIVQLRQLAHKHHFLILEDRKFADIGALMQQQYAGGLYRIAEWANIVTVHPLVGAESIAALAEMARRYEHGILLIAQLSSAGALIDEQYTNQAVQLARTYADCVVGFIAQNLLLQESGFMVCTPGIHAAQIKDAQGQQYHTPEVAIAQGTDSIIVGRAICQAADPRAAAHEYRLRAWHAYQERCLLVEV